MTEEERLEGQIRARKAEIKRAHDEMLKRTGKNLNAEQKQEYDRWKAMGQDAAIELDQLERRLAELKKK